MGAAFQTYDFTLAAGGAIQIPATGSFFRVQSATGKVNVTAEFGALKGLGVGQGARSPFRILQVQDASGSANVGTIIVGDAEFVDDRISGEVSVIDGELSRSKAGLSFIAYVNQAAVIGQYSFLELWNPAGSGRRGLVTQFTISNTIPGGFALQRTNVIQVAGVTPISKSSGTGASALKFGQGASVGVAGIAVDGANMQSGIPLLKPFKQPWVIEPNSGLVLYSGVQNCQTLASFEFNEESL